MKEVRGIKLLSNGGIFLNGLLLLFFCYLLFFLSPKVSLRGNDLFEISLIFLGVLSAILYPVQLLVILRNYYLGRLPTSGIKAFFHLYRIGALLFTLFQAFLAAAGSYEVYSLHYHRGIQDSFVLS